MTLVRNGVKREHVWDDVIVVNNKPARASGTPIVVPPGIAIKPIVVGRSPVGTPVAPDVPRGVVAWARYRLEYSEDAGCFVIAAFGVDRGNAPIEVSGAFFRTVRVHTIAMGGVIAALPGALMPYLNLRDRNRGRFPPILDFTAEESRLLTAVVYRIAEISGDNPALAVAETLRLKQRTATNWILRAREAGYMQSIEHRTEINRLARKIRSQMPELDLADELVSILRPDRVVEESRRLGEAADG